jgi:hypothetical protein
MQSTARCLKIKIIFKLKGAFKSERIEGENPEYGDENTRQNECLVCLQSYPEVVN